MRKVVVILALVAPVACETGPLEKFDTRDAGASRDAGVVAADTGVTMDASQPPRDGGFRDAGVRPDAGMGRDAGVDRDGGEPVLPDIPDDVRLYLNVGDSIGDGFNAGRDRGYFDLVCTNHTAYPAYAAAHLTARYPGVVCRNRASSGATSQDVVRQTRMLPPSGGDTVVTIHVGGNDFNDEITTIISSTATQIAIQRWESNMATVMSSLTAAYRDDRGGRALVVLIANIHDPTDGMGTIPPNFTNGFCSMLQNPIFTPTLRANAIANHTMFNEAIRNFALNNDARLVDEHTAFLGHGMNAMTDRWIDNDCAHLDNTGHHELRRLMWSAFANETF